MKGEDTVEIDYDLLLEDTGPGGALLIDRGNGYEWVPRSQIVEHNENARTITVPEWLVYQRGWI